MIRLMENNFKQEKTNASFELTFTQAEYDVALEVAYKKEGGKYRVHGFRAGKAPRKMIEKAYGEGVFIEPAIDHLFRQGYKSILEANPDFEPIAPPELDFDLPETGGVKIKGTVETIPQFKLGKYTGCDVKKVEIKVTDKDVERFLADQQQKRARSVEAQADYKVASGDTVTLDFRGSIDGIEFPGGTAEDYELVIGSNSFIDTFEDQIIGMKVDDTKDVKVTFPKEYHANDLAGKPAVFAIKVKKIMCKELPTIDDKFAKESSEFETLAEFKKYIKENLEKSAEVESKQQTEDALINAIVSKTELEVPEKMVERQLDMMMDNINRRLSMQGFNLEMFAGFQGTTVEEIRNQHRESAITTIKTRLILDEIAKVEKIIVTDEELETIIMETAEKVGKKDKDLRKDKEFLHMLRTNKTYDKVTDFLKAKNNIK